jgi:SHS2 domain-containing protein
MPYEILPHTADLRLKIWGKTVQEVFESALAGLTAVQKKDIPLPSQYTEREIALQAQDVTALLVDFLNEALALSAIHKEVYPSAIFTDLTQTHMRARLQGAPTSDLDEDIKAVTYHEANLIKNEKGEWETTLVFDI